MFRKIMTLASMLAGVLVANAASAATVFETAQLVATSASADALLPETITFEVTTAGTYTITLRDLLVVPEAKLASLRAVVVRDLQSVTEVEVIYPGGSPAPDPVPAAETFTATPGTYRILVLAEATGESGVGGFGVTVIPQAGGTALVDVADSIEGDASPGPGQSVLQTTFDIADDGNYTLQLADHAFPVALQTTNVLLLRRTSGAPVEIIGGSGLPGAFPGTVPFTAVAGTYELLVLAIAATGQAGLYSVTVSGGPGSNVVYSSTNPVGGLPRPTELTINTAGQYSLTTTDAEFPVALSSFAVAVIQNGTERARRTTTGRTDNITTAQGTAQLFVHAQTADPNGVGALSIRYAMGSTIVHANVHTVDANPASDTPAIYTFAPSQPVTAGNFRLALDDLRFLSPLVALDAAVVQNDQIVDSIDAEGELTVPLAGGRVKVIVAATPPPSGGNGLFGVTLTAQQGGAVVFDSTQGVGGLFRSFVVQIPTTGRYDISLADLEFPARLRTNALGLTLGSDVIAQVFGSGTLPPQQLVAGTYVLNFIGQPATGQQYGAFAAKVADSTPAPTVTLTAAPTSVTSGERSTLTWSSTNATSCTADSGWSGAKTTSGTEQTAPLTTNTTFNITCTGVGGSGTASVSVTVAPPTSNRSGGGGGGAADPLLLIYMSGLLALAAYRRRRAA